MTLIPLVENRRSMGAGRGGGREKREKALRDPRPHPLLVPVISAESRYK